MQPLLPNALAFFKEGLGLFGFQLGAVLCMLASGIWGIIYVSVWGFCAIICMLLVMRLRHIFLKYSGSLDEEYSVFHMRPELRT